MTGKEVGDVVGHAGGECACCAVMVESHAKEGRGDGVCFDVVLLGKACDKAVKVCTVCIFDTVVVNYEGKINRVDIVGEHAGLGLVVTVLEEEGCDVFICVKAGLAEAWHGFVYAGVEKTFASFILLYVRRYVQIIKELIRK